MAENRQQQEIKEITNKLEQGIKELFESEKYRGFLKTMSKFHNYSLNNTMLICMQKPEATLIAGYNAWQKDHERHVLKGEKGIRIFAPAPYKVKEEREVIDPITRKSVLDEHNQPVKEVVEVKKPAFKVISVFDVSQTEGKEIPSIGADELLGDVEDYGHFFDALERSCPVSIGFEDIEGAAKGYYHQEEHRIAINEGMSEVQNVKTLIHEMAHQKLHAVENVDKNLHLSRSAKEVEAESIAYVICQHYGIDTADYSFAYLAGWSEGKDTPELKASLDRIRKAANEMINEIDSHIAEINLELQSEQGKQITCYLKISGNMGSEYGVDRISGTPEQIEAALNEVKEAGKTEQPIENIEEFLESQGIVVLSLGNSSDSEPIRLVHSEYEYDVDTNEIYRDGAALGREMSREEQALRLAIRIDEMAYETDLYEYRDTVEDRAEFVLGIQKDLLSGKESVEEMREWFQEFVDEEAGEAEDAKKILDGLDAFLLSDEPKERFSVTETSDAYAPGDDFAIWDQEKEDYLQSADGTVQTFSSEKEAQIFLTGKPDKMEKEVTISFYVAECMEYKNYGEYHDGLTLKRALEIYERIPAENMMAGKGIGFDLHDGSIYSGQYALMINEVIQDEAINQITYYRNNPLVQQAINDCREEMSNEKRSMIEAGSYYVGKNAYLEIQLSSDESWDYTLYDKYYQEIDGGQMGDSAMSFADARNEILVSYGLMQENLRGINPDTLQEQVEKHEGIQLLPDYQKQFVLDKMDAGYDVTCVFVDSKQLSLIDHAMTKEEVARIDRQMGYADIPKMIYTTEQWKEIESGMKRELDVRLYASPDYTAGQMKEIRIGLDKGVDVTAFVNPDFSDRQMREIRRGVEAGIDVSSYAKLDIGAGDMRKAFFAIKDGANAHENQSKIPEPEQDSGLYRYYSTQRPVMPGTFPGKPTQIQNFDSKEPVCGGKMKAWGYLEYAKPLTEKQMSDYELNPAIHETVAKEQPSFSTPKIEADKVSDRKLSVMENLHKKQAQIAKADAKQSKMCEKGVRE